MQCHVRDCHLAKKIFKGQIPGICIPIHLVLIPLLRGNADALLTFDDMCFWDHKKTQVKQGCLPVCIVYPWFSWRVKPVHFCLGSSLKLEPQIIKQNVIFLTWTPNANIWDCFGRLGFFCAYSKYLQNYSTILLHGKILALMPVYTHHTPSIVQSKKAAVTIDPHGCWIVWC